MKHSRRQRLFGLIIGALSLCHIMFSRWRICILILSKYNASQVIFSNIEGLFCNDKQLYLRNIKKTLDKERAYEANMSVHDMQGLRDFKVLLYYFVTVFRS